MPVALVALLLLIYQQTPKRAAWLGFFWGLGQFSTGVGWVYVVIDKFGGMPTAVGLTLIALLVMYLALYPALFAYILQRVNLTPALRYLLLAPSLWLVIDWFRGWFLTGFPWLWPGYSQIDGPLASFALCLAYRYYPCAADHFRFCRHRPAATQHQGACASFGRDFGCDGFFLCTLGAGNW